MAPAILRLKASISSHCFWWIWNWCLQWYTVSIFICRENYDSPELSDDSSVELAQLYQLSRALVTMISESENENCDVGHVAFAEDRGWVVEELALKPWYYRVIKSFACRLTMHNNSLAFGRGSCSVETWSSSCPDSSSCTTDEPHAILELFSRPPFRLRFFLCRQLLSSTFTE